MQSFRYRKRNTIVITQSAEIKRPTAGHAMRRAIVKSRVPEEENSTPKMTTGWVDSTLQCYLFLYIRPKMNVSKHVLKILNGMIISNVS